MVYWEITFKDGSKGFQVMDGDLCNARVLDAAGNEVVGELEYTTTDTNPPLPEWANA